MGISWSNSEPVITRCKRRRTRYKKNLDACRIKYKLLQQLSIPKGYQNDNESPNKTPDITPNTTPDTPKRGTRKYRRNGST